MTCTFFGHKNASEEIYERLNAVIVDLIKNRGVRTFYVGNNGNFDFMVRKNLEKLKDKYKYINYAVVLAYMPNKNCIYEDYYDNTVFPEELANVFPKYAIVKRNEWMINKSDYVVTYVNNSVGGAAKFKELARRRGKIIIDI